VMPLPSKLGSSPLSSVTQGSLIVARSPGAMVCCASCPPLRSTVTVAGLLVGFETAMANSKSANRPALLVTVGQYSHPM
jgi:hypothetical protein